MLLYFGCYIICNLSITVPAALHIWVLLTYCELNINLSYPLLLPQIWQQLIVRKNLMSVLNIFKFYFLKLCRCCLFRID